MKLVHLQIFSAVMALGLVGAGVGAAAIHSEKQAQEQRLARAEGELKTLRGLGVLNPAKPRTGPSVDYGRENAELAKRLRALEQRVQELERENLALKDQLKGAGAGAVAHQKPLPGEIVVNAPAPAGPSVDPSAPPPPPVDVNDSWGSAEDVELDEIVSLVGFSKEQRGQVQQIIREGQTRFLERLQQLSSQPNAQAQDIMQVERIGREVSDDSNGRIEGLCTPDQLVKWRAYRAKQEELR